ncbi:ribosomal-protein-alanine N-acetyltransferase [Anaeromicrobium sediminis]|uniref:[Ribosomal protein bS18]-alanine N-acetyltransferase n=2 Tax=Anaeromicrobium sediminis TaxID=1478221 RepID=A0A267MKV3_9FIRM|nr:ribosomal-protein-alanine N-acetyltransferase [Anaeromicrobium sediminis]
MTIDDIEHVLEVENSSFPIPWSENAFRKEMEENNLALYVVVEEKDRVVGYAGMWIIGDEGHITNVAVHPNCRKKGYGDLLIDKLLNEGDKKGINAYTLEVRVSNIPAQRLYEKYGFKSVGIRPKYYEDNKEDAMIMWR